MTVVNGDNTLVTVGTSDVSVNGDNTPIIIGTSDTSVNGDNSHEDTTSKVEEHIVTMVTTEPSSNDESSPQVNTTCKDKELIKGCGHNTVQFSNDLLYDLD